jgi:VanZ family protein
MRKFGHITEYCILGMLVLRAFRAESEKHLKWRDVVYTLLVVILYAASDEFHQSFVPTRTASIIDVGIDTLGGMLALGISILLRFCRMKAEPL